MLTFRFYSRLFLIFFVFPAVPLLVIAEGAEIDVDFERIPFELKEVKDRIIPIDVNNDNLADLVTANENTLSIYLQKNTGASYDFTKADISLSLPGSSVGWDLDWNTNSKIEKAVRIVALIDGKQVISWPIENDILGESKILLDNLSGSLPLGAYPLDFVRDINGDQLNDYIIPGTDYHSLFLQSSNSQFDGNIKIRSNTFVRSTLLAENELTSDIGQRVRIGNIRIRDVNGDGINDLISFGNEILEVFLSTEDGQFKLEPSYGYDFNIIEERLGNPSFEDIDLSNLSAITRYTYDALIEDIDGDDIEDLLIREAGKISFYSGTATGMDLEQPAQVLRSSGNVFNALLMDEDNDGAKDLWLLRLEDISLARAFVWLAISGDLKIEMFIYKNQGKAFARRPHRKKTLVVSFPSIMNSIDLLRDKEELAESSNLTRTLAVDFQNKNANHDLIILDQEGVGVHMDVLADHLNENLFLGLVSDILSKDEFTVDLRQILGQASVQGQKHLDLVKNQPQDFTLSLGEFAQDLGVGSDFVTTHLNNDGVEDIIVFTQRKESTISGLMFLSR